MKQYLDLIQSVLSDGVHKPNRTGIDTISSFSETYTIDLQKGFPLLTTKNMAGFRWNSLIHEFLWYLSGEEHIQNLQEETSIWNDWADENGMLDTAYGRFWRRYPIPGDESQIEGEAWADTADMRWVNDDDIDSSRWLNGDNEYGDQPSFDQLQYVIDMLNQNPQSRRLVISAWHPANATVSTLPPCHYSFVFNVQGDRLNCHLTQRSGDVALGIPFNIAAYSLLTHAVANQTGFEVGEFSHTIVDAHIYCSGGDRAKWYRDNLNEFQKRFKRINDESDYESLRQWVEHNAPAEEADQTNSDHIPGLLTQLSRTPRDRPSIEVSDKPIDELQFEDIQLQNYNPYDGIEFAVAE